MIPSTIPSGLASVTGAQSPEPGRLFDTNLKRRSFTNLYAILLQLQQNVPQCSITAIVRMPLAAKRPQRPGIGQIGCMSLATALPIGRARLRSMRMGSKQAMLTAQVCELLGQALEMAR